MVPNTENLQVVHSLSFIAFMMCVFCKKVFYSEYFRIPSWINMLFLIDLTFGYTCFLFQRFWLESFKNPLQSELWSCSFTYLGLFQSSKREEPEGTANW